VSYCQRCGGRLPGPPPAKCAACGYEVFVNLRPTGSVVLVDEREERFLALHRVREPSAGRLDLPGGFCDGFEHPADAAVREAREELGVEVELGPFIGMYIGTYRYQQEDLPVLDAFWLASIVSGEIVLDPAEASGHTWLDLRKPPAMAFATMDRALADVTRRRIRIGLAR
jgi:8-oxo-dGTP diphosphatase